jgi:hypothetical protein
MNCEQIRTLMMDYLYDELSKEDHETFNAHLDQCRECREEMESLKTTSGILQQWKGVESEIRVIAVKERSFTFAKFKEFLNDGFFRPKKLAIGFACAFSAIFLFLALANTEISISNGNFKMRMSLFDGSEQLAHSGIANSSQAVEELLRENLQLTRSLIEQSEARQRQELAYVLSSFKEDIDLQRYQDLSLIKYGLKELQKNTYQKMEQIDSTLTEFVRPADIRY